MRPKMLYSVSLDGVLTVHPIKDDHDIIQVTEELWIYRQKDGSTHELWMSRAAALRSCRRDLKRMTNFLIGIYKKISSELETISRDTE